MTAPALSPFDELDAILKDVVRQANREVFRDIESFLVGETLDRVVSLVRQGALGDRVNEYTLDDGERWSQPLLVSAAGIGCEPLVEALIDAGADLDRRDTRDDLKDDPELHTAIEEAARADAPTIVRLLVDAGADVNAFGNVSPLFHVCCDQDVELVRFLLANGADPMKRNMGGHTPMQYDFGRSERTNPEIKALLREAAAPQIAKKRGSAITVKRQKRMYSLGESFGATEIVQRYRDADLHWSVILVRSDYVRVTRLLEDNTNFTRVERDAHKRVVPDADLYDAVFQLAGSEWSIVTQDTGEQIAIDQTYDTAQALSKDLHTDAVAVVVETVRGFHNGHEAEQHEWSEEAAIYAVPVDADSSAVEESIRQYRQAFDDWLGNHRILIPPFEYASDGYLAGIRLWGIRKSDLAGADLIIRREFEE